MVVFSFFSWFRPWWKTSETDYETVLSRLSKDINSVQSRLVHVKQRERRASVTLTLYAILLWLAYAISLWYWSAEKRLEMSKGERLQLWAPVALGLAVIISTRFLVRWWYRRIANGEEKHLRSLQRTRRKKIDEIKLATRYDHLRNLLEKYDDTAVRGAEGEKSSDKRKRTATTSAGAKGEQQQPPRTPNQQQTRPSGKGGPTGNNTARPVGTSANGAAPSGTAPSGRVTAMTGTASHTLQAQDQFQRTWLDRVADKILGSEMGDQKVAGAEQRYALICRICFTHNGLCPREDWEEVQYICPRCGTFNSRRPSSAPVSSPWARSAMENGRSRTESMASTPPVSPSPSRLQAQKTGQDEEEEGREEHEKGRPASPHSAENDEMIKDSADEDKGSPGPLRSRKSVGRVEDQLEEMEVD